MRKRYVIKTVATIVKNYTKLVAYLENKWANKHASSFRNYTLFKKGVHSTLIDVSDLSQLWTHIAFHSQSILEILPTLNIHQVYILRQVPKDLVRISPILLLSPLPGAILILPIFFAFPYIFLSRAFWTPEQCKTIDTKRLAYRLDRNIQFLLLGRLMDILNSSLSSSNYSEPISRSLEQLHSVLSQISLSRPISMENIPALLPAFKGPLSLEQLDKSYLASLLRLHGLSLCSYAWTMNTLLWSNLYMKKSILKTPHIIVLKKHAYFLYAEDLCMQKDKLFSDSSLSVVQNYEFIQLCLLRGINPYLSNSNVLKEKLRFWVSASTLASGTDFSFRLHLPFLLYYNFLENSDSVDKV
uniref:SJCHGC02167 protein n=1 Tax=Schistosoma japonicum TaxID=6182 RepID=Q5DET9_SCHJA|nr:SJCHGC02167 protein [Schistosoma japonicum]